MSSSLTVRTLFVAAVAFGAFALVPGASAVHTAGVFELDGDAFAGAASGDDWSSLFPAGSPPGAIRKVFLHEPVASDATYFTGGNTKDFNAISDWQWGGSAVPDKNEINDAFAVHYDANGYDHLYFGLDRYTSGESAVGFWFLQNGLALANGPNGTKVFVGEHAVGDLFLTTEFTNGGTVGAITAYEWVGPAGSPAALQAIGSSADCSSASLPAGHAVCGRLNSVAVPSPWPYTPKSGPSGTFPARTFLEGGLNLTQLFGTVPCFSTFLAETRSSQELTAQLKDFAFGSLKTCDVTIEIGPAAADNPVGTTHDMTVTVRKDLGDGVYVPAAGETVEGTLEGPGSFVVGTCTTDAAGTCVLTIASSTTGTTQVTAWVNVTIGASVVHRSTDGSAGNSAPASKTWHPIASSTVTTPVDTDVAAGETVQDTVVVTGALGTPTGDVTFWICAPTETTGDPPTCQSGGTLLGTSELDANGTASSPTFTPTSAGVWCFRAAYSGDATYEPSDENAPTECVTVAKATATMATTSSPQGDTVPGVAATDTATVDGIAAFPAPTGTVTFHLCGPAEVAEAGCPSGGSPVGDAVALDAGSATSGAADPATARGKHCWRAEYSGDANYEAASHTDASLECFTVLAPISSLDKAVRILPDGTFGSSALGTPGASAEFRLTYTNGGNAPATGVVLTDPVPAHTTFASCSDGCTVVDGVVTWDLGTVAAGDGRVVTFVVTLDATYDEAETTITNVATVDTSEEDPTDSPPVTIVVPAAPDLRLAKSVAAASVGLGGEVTFDLAYWNDGDENVASATITDTIPAGTSFVSCTGGCAESGGVVTWEVSVPAGTSALAPAGTVSVTVLFESLVGCQVCNAATIASFEQDGGAVADESSVCLDVDSEGAASAAASGAAFAARTGLVGAVDELVPVAESAQEGPGASDERAEGPGVSLPSQLTIATFASSAASTVATGGAHQVSISEVANIDILGGLVVAEKVRSYAEAFADGTSAGYSTSGAWFEGLFVDGTPVGKVAPNTRIDLGGGAYVVLREETGAAVVPGGLSGADTTADLTVTMIRVHTASGLDIVVAQAVAHAEFPRAVSCDPDPEEDVDADAAVYRAGPVTVGAVEAPPEGGSAGSSGANSATPQAGWASSSSGASGVSGGAASAFAEVKGLCLFPSLTGCLVSAEVVRAQANSDGGVADDAGTVIRGLVVAGESVSDTPPPGTSYPLPGGATLLVNDQVAEPGGLTVRGLVLVLPTGEEIVVTEAHART